MNKSTKYQLSLFLFFLVVWIWAAINPVYPKDWLLENYLVFFFVPLIIFGGIYFRLSNISYTLITLFMILHVIGSHYTYAEVPFGFMLQEFFHTNRNMYDRLVHFCFGLLLVYPIREAFIRVAKLKGFWSYYFPFDVIVSFSAIYELIEWFSVISMDAALGVAFLGAQGDIFDAQKDMLMATIGALITLTVVAVINWSLEKNFWKEIKKSLQKNKNDKPLGEFKIQKMLKEKNKK